MTNLDSRELKERIVAAVPIESYIGRTVSLKRSGRGFLGLCPFHKDSHPSFSVLPEPGTFRCFACGKSGDLFSFVMERESVDFREALDLLADYAGLERATRGSGGPDKRIEKLIEVNEAAIRNYREALQGPPGSGALRYLVERGVRDEAQNAFEIGASPDDWQWLSNRIGRPVEMRELGLSKEGRRGLFDFFRGRLIFPIRDERGRAVGFGGRVLPGDDNPAKYVNSSDSPVFHKSRILYGLFQAREALRQTRECIVVEGYLDVIGLWQIGIANVVAPLGTALSPEHLRLLKRYSDRVVFLYDGDDAGRAAALRGARIAIDSGEMETYVILLPPGRDPFDLAGELSAADLRGVLSNRLSCARFLAVETMFPRRALPPSDSVDFSRAAKDSYLAFTAEGLGLEEKRAARGRLLDLTRTLKRESDRDLFLNEGARILRVEPSGLRNDAGLGAPASTPRAPGPSTPVRPTPPRVLAADETIEVRSDPAQVHREHQLLQWAIHNPALAGRFVDVLNEVEFSDPDAEALWRHMESRLLVGDLWTPETIANGELPGELFALILSLVPSGPADEDAIHSAEGFQGLLLTHRAHAVKTEIAILDRRLAVADSVERDELYSRYMNLMQEERRLTDAIRTGDRQSVSGSEGAHPADNTKK